MKILFNTRDKLNDIVLSSTSEYDNCLSLYLADYFRHSFVPLVIYSNYVELKALLDSFRSFRRSTSHARLHYYGELHAKLKQ